MIQMVMLGLRARMTGKVRRTLLMPHNLRRFVCASSKLGSGPMGTCKIQFACPEGPRLFRNAGCSKSCPVPLERFRLQSRKALKTRTLLRAQSDSSFGSMEVCKVKTIEHLNPAGLRREINNIKCQTTQSTLIEPKDDVQRSVFSR